MLLVNEHIIYFFSNPKIHECFQQNCFPYSWIVFKVNKLYMTPTVYTLFNILTVVFHIQGFTSLENMFNTLFLCG